MRKVLSIVGRSRLGKPAFDLRTMPLSRQAGFAASTLSGAIASGFAGCWVGAGPKPPGGVWLAAGLMRPSAAAQKTVKDLANLVEGDGQTGPPEAEDRLRWLNQ